MNIVICEDDERFRTRMEEIVREWLARENSNSRIALSCEDGKTALDYAADNKELTIYFLDIILKGDISGFDIAKRVREKDYLSSIVFITSYAQKITLTYEYKLELMDFIIKSRPDTVERKVKECLGLAESRQKTGYSESLTILSRRFNTTIRFDDIYMIEAVKGTHKLLLHHKNGLFEFYSSVSEIMERLDKRFVRCHKSVIVNTSKIARVDKRERLLILDNGIECEYSSACRELKNI